MVTTYQYLAANSDTPEKIIVQQDDQRTVYTYAASQAGDFTPYTLKHFVAGDKRISVIASHEKNNSSLLFGLFGKFREFYPDESGIVARGNDCYLITPYIPHAVPLQKAIQKQDDYNACFALLHGGLIYSDDKEIFIQISNYIKKLRKFESDLRRQLKLAIMEYLRDDWRTQGKPTGDTFLSALNYIVDHYAQLFKAEFIQKIAKYQDRSDRYDWLRKEILQGSDTQAILKNLGLNLGSARHSQEIELAVVHSDRSRTSSVTTSELGSIEGPTESLDALLAGNRLTLVERRLIILDLARQFQVLAVNGKYFELGKDFVSMMKQNTYVSLDGEWKCDLTKIPITYGESQLARADLCFALKSLVLDNINLILPSAQAVGNSTIFCYAEVREKKQKQLDAVAAWFTKQDNDDLDSLITSLETLVSDEVVSVVPVLNNLEKKAILARKIIEFDAKRDCLSLLEKILLAVLELLDRYSERGSLSENHFADIIMIVGKNALMSKEFDDLIANLSASDDANEIDYIWAAYNALCNDEQAYKLLTALGQMISGAELAAKINQVTSRVSQYYI